MGVEEEFFLVGGAGALLPMAPEALAATDDSGVDLKPELLRYQVESATEVCTTGPELAEQLTVLRKRLAEGAARRQARLAASGTVVHAQAGDALIGPGRRYQEIAERFGQLVVRGLVCGCHVHVGVDGQATALKVANHLRPWLPMLLALSANSPFVDGSDSGYASSRHLLYMRWPSAGPPPYLDSVDQYEELLSGLLDTGAALDRKMVYWDIRPSEQQPTVEIRVADVQGTVREATFLAVLIRTLGTRALDLAADGVAAPRMPTELIKAGLWRAAKDGLTGQCTDPVTGRLKPVRAVLDDLVREHTPELRRTGELSLIESTLDWLDEHGNGADRQRRAYARRQRLDDVVDAITVSG